MKTRLLFSVLILATFFSHAQESNPDDKGVFHFGPWEEQWGYAQGRKVGNTLYISGTVGRGETMEQQVKSVFEGIQRTLEAYGLNASHVVKEVIYTTDIEATKKAVTPRMEFYDGNTPAATWVQIERLFSPGSMIEVEVEARFDLD